MSEPEAAAASASNAAPHAALCAPMPLQPKNSGPAVSRSQSLATDDFALVQIRITDGNKPIGLCPPSSSGGGRRGPARGSRPTSQRLLPC